MPFSSFFGQNNHYALFLLGFLEEENVSGGAKFDINVKIKQYLCYITLFLRRNWLFVVEYCGVFVLSTLRQFDI